jgi:hypothetical protein
MIEKKNWFQIRLQTILEAETSLTDGQLLLEKQALNKANTSKVPTRSSKITSFQKRGQNFGTKFNFKMNNASI